MVPKVDAEGNPMKGEDGQTLMTQGPEPTQDFQTKGVIDFPAYIAEQRVHFSEIHIPNIVQEERIQKLMASRPVTYGVEIANEILVTEGNREEVGGMAEEEQILYFIKSFDQMVKMDA
jgi:hypothetical protein